MAAMATYVRAGLPEVATALAALTGEPHPLAITPSAPAATPPDAARSALTRWTSGTATGSTAWEPCGPATAPSSARPGPPRTPTGTATPSGTPTPGRGA